MCACLILTLFSLHCAAKLVEKYDKKLYELMQKTSLDKLIASKRPFTTFISAKYLLDRFNQVETKYLSSEYGLNDLQHILKYLVISQPIYFDYHSVGETSCKSPWLTTPRSNQVLYI
jgi:hypothetical protein